MFQALHLVASANHGQGHQHDINYGCKNGSRLKCKPYHKHYNFQLFNFKHWAVHFIPIQPEQVEIRLVLLSNAHSKRSLFSAMFYRKKCWYKQNNVLSQGVFCTKNMGTKQWRSFKLPECLREKFQISDAMSTVQHNGNLEENFEEINESLDRQDLNSNFRMQFFKINFLII